MIDAETALPDWVSIRSRSRRPDWRVYIFAGRGSFDRRILRLAPALRERNPAESCNTGK